MVGKRDRRRRRRDGSMTEFFRPYSPDERDGEASGSETETGGGVLKPLGRTDSRTQRPWKTGLKQMETKDWSPHGFRVNNSLRITE